MDGELYLPEDWFTPAFTEKQSPLKLPPDRAVLTKAQLGLQMIRRAQEAGRLPFSFVACDDFYGQQTDFLKELRALGLVYMADVPVKTRVYRHPPTMGVPPRHGKRGRSPSRRRALDVPLYHLQFQMRRFVKRDFDKLNPAET